MISVLEKKDVNKYFDDISPQTIECSQIYNLNVFFLAPIWFNTLFVMQIIF